MKKLILSILPALLLSLGVFANPDPAEELPGNFHMTTLKNGLQVLVIYDNAVPLATIELVVRNGAYTESAEYDGLSHLYEHMFFKANNVLNSQEAFMERVNELGIAFNGTTSNERVNYFVTLSNENLVPGLQFMNDAIRYPLFLEEEMKKENPVVDAEFQRSESNPFFFLYKDLQHQMWGENFSRKNTIGDHDIIMTATPEKMRIIQEKYYYPNNTMLVVAGQVDYKEVFKEAKKIFGDWEPADFDPFEKWEIPEFEPLTEDKFYVTNNENAQVPVVMIGYHGPDTRGDIKSTYAADVFSFILGQASSKLQREMVDAGLALQVDVGYQTCKFTGPITITLVPVPGKTRAAMKALNEHIDQWDSEDYFTDDQMETAKNLLAIDDAYGKEKTSEFVHTVTYWWAVADIQYYTNYVENLQEVTREDITNYVTTYIKGKPRVTGILVNDDLLPGVIFNE